MAQEVKTWELKGASSLAQYLTELIGQGYFIDKVVDTEYEAVNKNTIASTELTNVLTKAIIIVEIITYNIKSHK